jgi:hypothetical protein
VTADHDLGAEPVPSIELLQQLQDALTLTFAFGHRQMQKPRWQPSPGSRAAAEIANTLTRLNGDPWGDDVPRTSYAAAKLLMTGVLDNLGSLRRLVGNPMPVIGPTVVARSVLELASTAWWLMDPLIGVRRRACRELVLSLTSARRAGQVAGELDDDEAKTEGKKQEANVLGRVSDLAIASPAGSKFNPKIEGEQLPDATGVTASMLKPRFPSAAGTTSFYRAYSAVTHGQFYGLMNFMTPLDQPDGTVLLSWQPSAPVLDSTIQIAILAFQEAFQRIRHLMGWSKIEYDIWSSKLAKIFNPL